MYRLILLTSIFLVGCSSITTTASLPQPDSVKEIHDPLEEVRIAMRMVPENLAQAYGEFALASPDSSGEFTVIGHSVKPDSPPECRIEAHCAARLIVRAAKSGQGIQVLTLFLPQYASLRRCAWTATFSQLSPQTEGLSDTLGQHGLNLATHCWLSQTKSDQ